MNWTGGRLSRHSNAKHSLRARQKQHFAKVQANLRNGAKKPDPLKLSFLGNTIGCNTGSRHQSSDSNLLRNSQPVSPHLNDFDELQIPLYNNSHHRSSPYKPRAKAQTAREPLLEKRRNAVPDDDLYSATPLPLESKRKHDLSTAQQEKESLLINEQESDFERRRRILRKGDWVGVSVQRPLQLAFTSPDHAELVGKRRKIAGSHRAKYNHKMQSIFRSPFAAHNQRGQEMAHLRMSDVRIAIDGREIPPGIGSSSVASRRREPSIHNHLFGQSQESSSDIMLFDNEELTRRRLQASEEKIYPGRQIYGDILVQYNGEPTVPRRSFAADTKHNGQEYQSTGASNSHSSTVGGGVSATHGQPIVSSSTTSLQHPVPHSSRTSVLLRSDSAEITASIVAQVGKAKPVVPSSELVDNEIWESWVGPVFDESSHQGSNDTNSQMSTQQMPISPGISHAPVDRGMLTEQGDEYVSTESGWVQSPQDGNLSQHSSQPFLATDMACGEELSSRVEVEPDIRKRKDPLAMETRTDVQVNHQPRQTEYTAQPFKLAEKPDLDNIWKKFVFGSSDDGMEGVESNYPKLNPPLYVQTQGCSPASSVLAVPSMGNSL